MKSSALDGFYLVGGTCLSLRYGHRKSIDLDFFSVNEFSNESLIDNLRAEGFDFKEAFSANRLGVFGFLDNVKVDFVRHHMFPMIDKAESVPGIRMFGDKDIIAMKISAILRRAVKKDFWDMAELLNYHKVADFVTYYEMKYPDQQLLISIPRALSYFDDAETSPNPDCLRGQTWEEVKTKIRQAVNEYLM
jgi:predicted nucleotidyltransferase component of viral defense system